MSDGLEDYMAKPTQDDLADPQELRDARAEERERQIDEARREHARAGSNRERLRILYYRYGGPGRRAEYQRAAQDAMAATARYMDLLEAQEEGS